MVWYGAWSQESSARQYLKLPKNQKIVQNYLPSEYTLIFLYKNEVYKKDRLEIPKI